MMNTDKNSKGSLLDGQVVSTCLVMCDPNCIFKTSVVKLEKEFKRTAYLFIVLVPLATWKVIEIIQLLIK